MVASHYPTLLDEDADGIVLLTHFGRPDEKLHGGRQRRARCSRSCRAPHGYVSPSWYAPGDMVPTWNHVTAHLYGVPEILSDDENLAVLEKLVDHFEEGMPDARSLRIDPVKAARIAKGTIGLRIPITRDRGAQEAQPEPHRRRSRQRRSSTSRATGATRHPELAAEMAAVEGRHPRGERGVSADLLRQRPDRRRRRRAARPARGRRRASGRSDVAKHDLLGLDDLDIGRPRGPLRRARALGRARARRPVGAAVVAARRVVGRLGGRDGRHSCGEHVDAASACRRARSSWATDSATVSGPTRRPPSCSTSATSRSRWSAATCTPCGRTRGAPAHGRAARDGLVPARAAGVRPQRAPERRAGRRSSTRGCSRRPARAAARGVVGISDFEFDDALGAWVRRFGAGFRGLRVRAHGLPAAPRCGDRGRHPDRRCRRRHRTGCSSAGRSSCSPTARSTPAPRGATIRTPV